MDKKIEQAVEDAASNVSCEVGNVSKDALVKIKDQLLGNTKKTDESFIFSLYQSVMNQRNDQKDRNYGKRK